MAAIDKSLWLWYTDSSLSSCSDKTRKFQNANILPNNQASQTTLFHGMVKFLPYHFDPFSLSSLFDTLWGYVKELGSWTARPDYRWLQLMEKIFSERLRAHTWAQGLDCPKASSSSWEFGPSSLDLVNKSCQESQSLSQEWRTDRAGKTHGCSSGCILCDPSPQLLHSSVSASSTYRNWMGKGKAGPWWFCAPHARCAFLLVLSWCTLAAGWAKRCWLLC